MIRWKPALMLALVASLAAGGAWARPPHGPGGRHGPPERMIEEHAEELGLDEETREAIRGLVDDSRDQAEELHAELHDLRRGMHDLLSEDEPDREAVMARIDAMGAVETQLHKHRVGTMLAIRAKLTPEQRQALTQLRHEGRERWLAPLDEACAEDAERLCGGAEGPFERMHCLRQQQDALSEGCSEAFRQRHREKGRGGWGGRPAGPPLGSAPEPGR
jgi:Spy/CpxP family protein refolding chaperone